MDGDTAAARHQHMVQELSAVSERWQGLQSAWPALLAAEAAFQYDTFERSRLEEEDEAVPVDAKRAVLALLDACFHAIVEVLPAEWEEQAAAAGAEAAAALVAASLAAVDEAEQSLLDQHAVVNGVRAVGQHLSALVPHTPAAAAAADAVYAAAAARMQLLTEVEGVELEWEDVVDVHQARAMAAAAHPALVPGSFHVAITSYEACLTLEQEHAGQEAVQRRVMELASTAADKGVFGLAAHYMRQLLELQRGQGEPAEVLLGTMRGALRAQLQLVAFLADTSSAVGGDRSVADDIRAAMALPCCVAHLGEAAGLSLEVEGQAAMAFIHTCTAQLFAAAPEGMYSSHILPGADVDTGEVQSWLDSLHLWLDVVDEGQEAFDALAVDTDALTPVLRNVMQALQVCAGHLLGIAGAPGPGMDCTLLLQQSYATCSLQLAGLLQERESAAEVAALLEEQLGRLLDGTDALTRTVLAAELAKQGGGAVPPARLQQSQARQVLLFGIQCSSAWGSAERWDSAHSVIQRVTEHLDGLGVQVEAGAPWAIGTLSRLECAVLACMAWLQLARAQRAQGYNMAFLGTLREHVLPPLCAALAEAEEGLFRQLQEPQSEEELFGAVVGAAVWHSGQDLARGALESLVQRHMNSPSVDALMDTYSQVAEQVDLLSPWQARAHELAAACATWNRLGGGEDAPSASSSSDMQKATSVHFLWRLPGTPHECAGLASQPSFWAGTLRQRAADAVLARNAAEGRYDCVPPLRQWQLHADAVGNVDTADLIQALHHLWGAAKALVSNFALSEEDGAGATMPLWAFECCAQAATLALRSGGQEDAAILELASAALALASSSTVEDNARLQLSIGLLQRCAARCLVEVGGAEAGGRFYRDATARTEVLVAAAQLQLHGEEDSGGDMDRLSKLGRYVCHLQSLHVAMLVDQAVLACWAALDAPGEVVGNPVATHLQAAMRAIDKYAPYEGVVTAYPQAAFCGFPRHLWAATPAVDSSHLQCLFHTLFEGVWQCIGWLAHGPSLLPGDVLLVSPHPFLAGRMDHITSLEGATRPACRFAYITAEHEQPLADAAAAVEASNQPDTPMLLLCIGILHKVGGWLETQSFASAVPAAATVQYNVHFAAGNAFHQTGNAAGTTRSRRRAVGAVRSAIAAALSGEGSPSIPSGGPLHLQRLLVTTLDELGVALLNTSLADDAAEAFQDALTAREQACREFPAQAGTAAGGFSSHCQWLTCAGAFEACLLGGDHGTALTIGNKVAAGVESVTGQGVASFWTSLAAFNIGRALAADGQHSRATSEWRRVLRMCEEVVEERQRPTCWYAVGGGELAQAQTWGPEDTPSLYSDFFSPHPSEMEAAGALAQHCRWHLAEMHHTTCNLGAAADTFSALLAAGEAAGETVQRADILQGLAAVQSKLGREEDAMVSMQAAVSARDNLQGQLAPQHTLLCCDVARHFLTYAQDADAAIRFLQEPLGLVLGALQHLVESLSMEAEVDADEAVVREGQHGDVLLTAAEVLEDEVADDTVGGIVAAGLASSLLGMSALAAVTEGDEDDSDSEAQESDSEEEDSAASSPPGVTAGQLLEHLAFPGGHAALLKSLVPELEDPELPSQTVAWQLGVSHVTAALHEHAEALRLTLCRQAALLWYHLGLALARHHSLPMPPGPLDSLHTLQLAPDAELVSALDTEGSDQWPQAQEAVPACLACWRESIRMELLVQQGSVEEEYVPQRVFLCSLIRAAHLLFVASSRGQDAAVVVGTAVQVLKRSSALRAATARDAGPVAFILLADITAAQGGLQDAKAVLSTCIDSLREAKDSLDGREAVHLMGALGTLVILAQMEALLLTHMGALTRGEEPDTSLVAFKGARQVLMQYTSAATANTARLFAWDQRLIELSQALGALYEQLGDAENGLHFRRTAAVQLEQRTVEEEECGVQVTAGELGAQRASIW